MTRYQMREMTRGGLAATVCLLALSGGVASGQWEQLLKLTAEDSAEGDQFGYSVSASGNTIVVGAIFDCDLGLNSGSAYVFDASTGEQLHKLTDDDGAEQDRFGNSVSISGNTIVVGAYWDDDAVHNSGSAFVFNATTGEQLHKLTVEDAAWNHNFGYSVYVSGSIIVIGATGDDPGGSAYLFDAVTGEQLHKLTADDAANGDHFGSSVAVSGNTIIVGAYDDDDACPSDPECDSGSAYVFDAATGEQLHKLTADDAAQNDYFGRSVSISGNTIVVGARGDDDAGSYSGSAYVFNATTGEQLHKLTADDGASSDYFGWSVSVSGYIIMVGAPGSGLGSAYVFGAATGEQLHKLTDDDGANWTEFGHSVFIIENSIVVGAPDDDDAGEDSGSAYVFQVLDSLCPADCTGPDGVPDGTVDVQDLQLILAQWGTAGPEGDCSGPYVVPDGVVDVHDLLAVLGAWGPCP